MVLQRLSLRRCRRAGIAGVSAALFADLDDHAVLGAQELDEVHDWLLAPLRNGDLAAAGTSSAARWPFMARTLPVFGFTSGRHHSASQSSVATAGGRDVVRRGASRRGRRPRRDRR